MLKFTLQNSLQSFGSLFLIWCETLRIYGNLKQLNCAGCSSSYIGQTCCHFKTRIEEHIKKDNKSHISEHLHTTVTCFDLYNSLCFKIIDKANSKFDLKIKNQS